MKSEQIVSPGNFHIVAERSLSGKINPLGVIIKPQGFDLSGDCNGDNLLDEVRRVRDSNTGVVLSTENVLRMFDEIIFVMASIEIANHGNSENTGLFLKDVSAQLLSNFNTSTEKLLEKSEKSD